MKAIFQGDRPLEGGSHACGARAAAAPGGQRPAGHAGKGWRVVGMAEGRAAGLRQGSETDRRAGGPIGRRAPFGLPWKACRSDSERPALLYHPAEDLRMP